MNIATSENTATSDIRAFECTYSPTPPALLDQILAHEQNVSVTVDGAYDTRWCRIGILDRQAKVIIPIRKNGRVRHEDCPAAVARNAILRYVRGKGRAGWKRRNGYHARSRADAMMRCLKGFVPCVALINRFNVLDTADVVRAA